MQYIINGCCHYNSDFVALLKKIAADGLYRCTQTCVVTLYIRGTYVRTYVTYVAHKTF